MDKSQTKKNLRRDDAGDTKPPAVSPPPAGKNTPHLIPMDDDSGIKNTKSKTADTKMPANVPRQRPNPSKINANASIVSPSADDDAKAREIHARKMALAKAAQQPIKTRRQFGIPEKPTSSSAAPKPQPRPNFEDDTDMDVKHREMSASRHANARKMPPPAVAASLRRSKENVSSFSTHSSGSASTTVTQNKSCSGSASTTVTQNKSSMFISDTAAKARIQAVSLVLEEDIGDADGIGNKKDASFPSEARKLETVAQRRHSMTDNTLPQKIRTTSDGSPRPVVARARRATIASHGSEVSTDSSNTKSAVGVHAVPTARRDSMSKTCHSHGTQPDAVQQHLALLAATQNHRPSSLLIADDNMEGGHISRVTTLDDSVYFEGNDNAEVSEVPGTNARSGAETMMNNGVGVSVAPSTVPGAYAVDGINASSSGHGLDDDSLFELEDDLDMENGGSGVVSSGASGNDRLHDPTFTDPNSHLYLDPELANDLPAPTLEAELHEVIVFDGRVLTEDVDQGWTAKHRRRLQCTLACLILGVIAAVIAGVSQLKRNKFKQQNALPTIEGWLQVGQNLTGPTDDDRSKFGYDISMDGTANRIAIGAPGKDISANELLVGEVQIMDWNGTQFLPNGVIRGLGPGSQAGTAVAMSKDGKRVAVASPFYAQSGGSVAVYEESSTGWKTVGQILVGDTSDGGGERFGSSIALNDAGDILAVGSSLRDSEQGSDTGCVKVFQLQTYSHEDLQDQWVQLGTDIFGENPGDLFGWSLAISSSGERLAAGSIGSTGADSAEFAGQVRIFDYLRESSSWSQVGTSLTGLAAFNNFGASCSLSAIGDVLAVGATGQSTTDAGVDVGHVRVFQSIATADGLSWQPLGQTLVGENALDSFGYSVAISEDGKVLAVGAPRNDEFAVSSGQMKVFEFDDSDQLWKRRGSSIGGSYEDRDLFGWSVAMSGNGSVVAGGAPFSSYDGRLNDVGTVRVYRVESD